MQEGISRGKFLEHAKVHTNMYGTSREAVDDIQREHKIPILDVDVVWLVGDDAMEARVASHGGAFGEQ